LLFAFQIIEKGCRLHDMLPYTMVCGEDTMLWRCLSIFGQAGQRLSTGQAVIYYSTYDPGPGAAAHMDISLEV